MSEVTTEKQFVMGVSTEDYDRCYAMAKKAGRKGVVIKGKTTLARFYVVRDKLWADEVKPDGTTLKQEVMDINTLPQSKEYHDSMKARLQRDYPDKDEAWWESHADVLDSANRATKRLILEGLPPLEAGKIISAALKDIFTDLTKDISGGEQ